MVDAQLTSAFETESRAVLDLHAQLRPRRRREARELARLERATTRLRADIERLRRERASLQRRHDEGAQALATATTPAWWGWTRLTRPLLLTAVVSTLVIAIPFELVEAPRVALLSIALFAVGVRLTRLPARTGVRA